MAKVADLRELEHQASLNWALAERAESEGNFELARELVSLAREADARALSQRNGAAVRY